MVRVKNRYLLLELHWQTGSTVSPLSSSLSSPPTFPSVTNSQLYRLLSQTIQTNFGDFGAAQCAALSVKYWNAATRICIVRAPRAASRIVQAAVTLITEVKRRRCVFRTLHLAGSMRTCQKAALKHNLKQLRALHLPQDILPLAGVSVAAVINGEGQRDIAAGSDAPLAKRTVREMGGAKVEGRASKRKRAAGLLDANQKLIVLR